jgi:pyrroline-5-carboxylate reductase
MNRWPRHPPRSWPYFRYLETIADWLSGRDIPTAAARRYVGDTFAAPSGELDSAGADFAEAHTTPGGLNEGFARDLDAAGTYDAMRVGLDALLARIAKDFT